jgi:hypothetical protein
MAVSRSSLEEQKVQKQEEVSRAVCTVNLYDANLRVFHNGMINAIGCSIFLSKRGMFKVMILVVRSTRGCIMRRIGNEQ